MMTDRAIAAIIAIENRKTDPSKMTLAETKEEANLSILGPFVFTTDLLLLLRGEVVLDVEQLSDLFWGLALDHVGDGLATSVKEGLDVQKVGSEDDFEKHLLVNVHELLVPLIDVGSLLAGIVGLVVGENWVTLVMIAPFDNLAKNRLVDVRNWDGFLDISAILEHVLDEDRTFGDGTRNLDNDLVVGLKLDDLFGGHLGCLVYMWCSILE